MSLRDVGAFETLSEGSRMTIFLALVRARLDRWNLTDFVEATVETPTDLGPTLSFSELRERSGIEDSGRFNYHLSELEGGFVAKTDEGYRLTRGGIEVATVLAQGWHEDGPERSETRLDAECPGCGSAVTAAYEDGTFTVSCETGTTFVANSVPPNVARADTIQEVRRKQTRLSLNQLTSLVDGICPKCQASLDPGVVTIPEENDVTFFGDGCNACGTSIVSNHKTMPLADPRVRAFYADHGQSFPGTSIWAVDLFDPDLWTEQPDGPHAKQFETVRGDERLVVTIDGSGIENVSREPMDA